MEVESYGIGLVSLSVMSSWFIYFVADVKILRLSYILLYKRAAFSLYVHLSIDTQVAFIVWLL